MSKGFKITLIILLSLIAFLLTGILIYLLANGSSFSFHIGSGQSQKLIEERKLETIKDISLNVNVVDITFKKSSEETIKIELYSDNCKEYEIIDEDFIKVIFKEKDGFRFMRKAPRIIVTVPENYDKNISINGEVTDIDIPSLDNANLTVDINVGDLDLGNLNKVMIDASTGDVKIKEVNDIKVEINTGDIKIESVNNSIDLDVNAGDIKIQKIDIKENGRIKLDTGNVKISKVGDIYVDAKTDLGSLKVQGDNRKSDITLTIRNNFGDIKVG